MKVRNPIINAHFLTEDNQETFNSMMAQMVWRTQSLGLVRSLALLVVQGGGINRKLNSQDEALSGSSSPMIFMSRFSANWPPSKRMVTTWRIIEAG